MEVIKDISYDPHIGEAGKLDLYLPEDMEKSTLLIYFHGGGLEAGDKSDEAEIYKTLASNGIACISANYRMYPIAVFPDYVEDAAKAVAWGITQAAKPAGIGTFDRVFIGGISAGSYLSMMLHFAPEYLKRCGINESLICGYIFDAGQPTVHYNILRERGEDTGSIRVDEAAPIWYVTNKDKSENTMHQRYLIMVSDHDMPCRKEQNEMLICTMKMHGCRDEQIDYRIHEGYKHVRYVHVRDENGEYPYARWLLDFMTQHSLYK